MTRPTPIKIPFLVCDRYESTNCRIISVASVEPPKPSRNWLSIKVETPNPRAMAKRMASMGTMASRVL